MNIGWKGPATFSLPRLTRDYEHDILRRELFIRYRNGGEKQTLGYFLNYEQDLTKQFSQTFSLSKCVAKSEDEEMVGELTTFQNCS